MSAADEKKSDALAREASMKKALTLGDGDGQLAAWADVEAKAPNRTRQLETILASAFSSGYERPKTGDDADGLALRPPWNKNIYRENMRELAWYEESKRMFDEARIIWASRRVDFLASVQSDVLAAQENLTNAIQETQDNLEVITQVLEVVVESIELPPEVRAQLEAKIAEIRVARDSALTQIRLAAALFRQASNTLESGTLPPVDEQGALAALDSAEKSDSLKRTALLGGLFLVGALALKKLFGK